MTRSSRRPIFVLATVAGFAAVSPLGAWDPRRAAAFRAEFEAEFPKTDVKAPALELERLAASLGIDVAPKDSKTTVTTGLS